VKKTHTQNTMGKYVRNSLNCVRAI